MIYTLYYYERYFETYDTVLNQIYIHNVKFTMRVYNYLYNVLS